MSATAVLSLLNCSLFSKDKKDLIEQRIVNRSYYNSIINQLFPDFKNDNLRFEAFKQAFNKMKSTKKTLEACKKVLNKYLIDDCHVRANIYDVFDDLTTKADILKVLYRLLSDPDYGWIFDKKLDDMKTNELHSYKEPESVFCRTKIRQTETGKFSIRQKENIRNF